MRGKSKTMFALLDTMFNDINGTQKKNGTGLFFRYDMKVSVDKKDETVYTVSIILAETGHSERTLQAFPYLKPKSMDRFTMEYQIMMCIVTIFTETALLQWNEISKMMNVDPELQEAAIKSKK